MINKIVKKKKRAKRHVRIRKKMSGNPECLRACVSRSNSNLYIQFIDDENGKVVAGFSTLNKDFKGKNTDAKNNIACAKEFGKFVGSKAKEKNISAVVFDRSGFKYHGKIKALAEGMREEGIKL